MPELPEFPDSLLWANLSRQPSVADFRGKALLVYFWTAGNQYCQRMLKEIRRLENQFEEQLYVVGIHCPRYPCEQEVEFLRKVINQFHIRHFVASDQQYDYWKMLGVEAWPTTIVVDPEGQVRGFREGINWGDEIGEYLDSLLEQAAVEDRLNYETRYPDPFAEPDTVLRFPSDVIQVGKHLYITDTGNNRVLETGLDGNVQRQFGSGNPGHWDGVNQDVGFDSPECLARLGEYIYVSDTQNHSIRRINVLNGEVDTIAGMGKWGQMNATRYENPKDVCLNYPTGLAAKDSTLYISMTGQNQIWALDLNDNVLSLVAGNGTIGRLDGEPLEASFYSPRQLTLVDEALLISDSENCLIRSYHLLKKTVVTLCGTEAGQKTGNFSEAALRYPQGMAYDAENELLWLADSGNQNLKCLEMPEHHVDIPPGQPGWICPKGISIHEGTIWATDVFMHALVRMDMFGGPAEVFQVKALQQPSEDYL